MKKILVTGFGPFDRFFLNPSDEIARALSEDNDNVVHRTLPVVFGEGRRSLLGALEVTRPEIVICFGLNGNIGHIALEEIAINITSSEIADTSGNIPEDGIISGEGPLAYRTRLPTREIMEKLRKTGIPARRSYSAGTYLCNEVFYTLMEWCNRNDSRGGFVHVPMATEMIATDIRMYSTSHMSMDLLKKAGRIILSGSI